MSPVGVLHEPIKHAGGLLGFIPPQLATLAGEPPSGVAWIHEIKLDGYRTCLVVDGDRSRAFTRNGHDWTSRYRPIVEAAREADCQNAVIDGEMIVQDEAGRSDFAALRRAIKGEPHKLVFYAFDLLELDGEDLRREALSARQELLNELIGAHDPAWSIQFSVDFGDGPGLLEVAGRVGLEGIVSKKADSRYRSGRTTTWLKTKVFAEEEFVVIGADHEPGKPAFALLSREGDEGLEYVGSAFVTLGQQERERFWIEIALVNRPNPSVCLPQKRGRQWVEPRLYVRAQHLGSGNSPRRLRMPSNRSVMPSAGPPRSYFGKFTTEGRHPVPNR